MCLDVFVDSQTVFNVISRGSITVEKRLQIDIHSLRQRFSRGEITQLAWIPGVQNVADALIKLFRSRSVHQNHPLLKLMRTNKLDIEPVGWVATKTFSNPKTSECQT